MLSLRLQREGEEQETGPSWAAEGEVRRYLPLPHAMSGAAAHWD